MKHLGTLLRPVGPVLPQGSLHRPQKTSSVPFPSVAIIADDLTGATDTAAVFARPRAAVPVSLDRYPPPEWRDHHAFAITTESRGCPAEAVYQLVSEAVRSTQQAGADLIYKKVDSNLRGNLGLELAAVADVLGRPMVLAPAFPARGRTTVGGITLVEGVPVAATEMGRDPQAPVRYSNIAELIQSQQPGLQVHHCSLEDLRAGRCDLSPEPIVIVDAETDNDLAMLAKQVLSTSPLPVLSGSAGFAAAVATQLFGPAELLSWPTEPGGPVLAVLASSSRKLGAQVEVVREAGVTVVPVICTEFTWEEQLVPELAGVIDRALAELKAGRDVVVFATGPLPEVPRAVDLVIEHLAHLAFVVAKRGGPAGLLLGGGSTAHAILTTLGAGAIEVDGEPLIGIAAGVLVGGHLAGRPVVLKPGAAGDDAAVIELLRYLRCRASVKNL